MKFEWDPQKAASNLKKHRVTFQEASTVLYDPLSTTFPDSPVPGEARFVTIGVSVRGRLLVVVHTDRGNSVRVISVRRATRHEREFYEQ